ncbi:MAG: site-specific DNA-methyltransferase [Halobacteriales archaeon]
METNHRIFVDDARRMTALDDGAVELVVTSPPYPMIEMWDEIFGELNPAISERLEEGAGRDAFELMHQELETVWQEIARVLTSGGIACINIGDATRNIDDSFRVYQNHSRIVDAFEQLGFEPLPEILWRKPVNSAAKFMGSGMLPPNAYATLEHEYILIFRNGTEQRSFEPGADRRYDAAYFWEERNEWFSDVWMDIKGTLQELDRGELRERSAAYPLEIPYRLINMYSVYGDTVLDPFWGTGTTSLAAIAAGRNSIGYEREAELTTVFEDRIDDVRGMTRELLHRRLDRHRDFVEERQKSGESLDYTAEHYDFPVMTKQERRIRLYQADAVTRDGDTYRVTHSEFEDTGSFAATTSD